MSRENVEVVRRVYDAAGRRETATLLALYDPDVELDPSRAFEGEGLASGLYRGHDGLRRFFREWDEAWENLEYDLDEVIDVGEQVVSVVTRRGRGKTSGAEVEFQVALLWTLRARRVVRVVWFPTREEALEAVGLRE
jgi:ketosteroid isomerase-like protein